MATPLVICDDSAMARSQIARALPLDWEVEIGYAADGAEALEAVRQTGAELLLLDLSMPILDGFETLRALREEGLAVKVIVVSGDVQPDARRRVMELGALEFLQKPLDPEQLREVLAQLGLVDGSAPADAERPESRLDIDLRDCYREVANIALGRAAGLLARLLDVFVILPVPNVSTLEVGELQMTLAATAEYDSVSAVCQGYIGAGIAGEALLLFNDASFADIARLMRYEGKLDANVELELLMDVANILIGACLKGIAEQLDVRFSQGHPAVLGRHCNVADLIAHNRRRWRRTLAIEICYRIEDYHINCDLLLLFTEDSLPTLNDKIRYLLNA